MSDTYDLKFQQNVTFTRIFEADNGGVPIDFGEWRVISQVRTEESVTSDLLIDLAPYFIPAMNNASTTLRVPGTITSQFIPRRFRNAHWDLFLQNIADPTEVILVMEGEADCDPAASKMVTPA